ncbi:MAG: FAD-binding oxidoreductase [Candidatus Melainabacteria bacterium]|nr:FAD-binding oxidoreductase [Candidatus Melainabacteria bacterium]
MPNFQLITDQDIVRGFCTDSSNYPGYAEALVRPKSKDEVVEILKEANLKKIPITTIGNRSSLTGSAAALGGWILDTSQMTKIIEINHKEKFALAEPGLMLSDLKKTILDEGLFYAPDPTSEKECFFGGSIATNASGSRTFKYGSTRKYVRALEVVLASGEVLNIRRPEIEKNTFGYLPFQNMVDIFVGSEGTLGVITKAEVELIKKPENFFGGMAFFKTLSDALDFVISVRKDLLKQVPTITPRAVELFDHNGLNIIRPDSTFKIPESAKAGIFFEQEYSSEVGTALGGNPTFEKVLDNWLSFLELNKALVEDTIIAEQPKQQEELRRLRHKVPSHLFEEGGVYVKDGGGKISTDWSVPIGKIHEIINYAQELTSQTKIKEPVIYGHIGNGHPHYNFIAKNANEKKQILEVVHKTCQKVISLHGTIAAEHGIGKIKKDFVKYQYPQSVINAMKAMKHSLDPNGILAPGNMF